MRSGPFLLALTLLASSPPAAGEAPPERLEPVMKAASVRQTIGPVDTPLSKDLADFLLDHPDLAADIAREHGIAPYRIVMRGPREFFADDGDGTTGAMTELEDGGGRRVYYGDGVHRSRVFPDIHAEAVVVMRMRPAPRPGCAPRVRSTFEVYVKLRNPLLSRLVSFLPFVRKTVVRKFSKAFLVADQVGRLLARTPQAVARDVQKSGLPERERARALALIGAQASARACPD